MHKYSAQGLAGGHTISFESEGRCQVCGYGLCGWVVHYQGMTFHLIKGLDTVCGYTFAAKV